MTAVKATCSHVVKGESCGVVEEVDVDVDATEWRQFVLRELTVQQAYPNLDEHQREVLLGHRNGWGFLCRSCWSEVFGEEEDE